MTTKLQNINLGMEEFVDHSFYEEWNGQAFDTDPLGAPLSPHHPWNKETKPRPQAPNWREKYTWATSPRWDRMPMDAECTARMWTTAAAQLLPENPYIDPTGHSLKLLLPQGRMPEMELEWKIPDVWNALERDRGRAYCVAYTALVGLNTWHQGMELMKEGRTDVAAKYEVPKGQRLGVGFWGAGAWIRQPPHDARRRRGHQLPDHHSLDYQRLAARPLGDAGDVRDRRPQHPDPGEQQR